METKNNDMDELFRQSFENFEPEPPEELKALIDKQLKFNTKRGLGAFWYLGITVLILAVSTFVYYSITKTELQKKTELVNNNSSVQKIDTDTTNTNQERNNASHAKKQDLTHTTLKDSSSNSKTTNPANSKILKEQVKVSNKTEHFQTKSLKEKSSINLTQKKSKTTKTKNRWNQNSNVRSNTLFTENSTTKNESKEEAISQKNDKVVDKNDKSIENSSTKENDDKTKSLSSKKDSTVSSIASVEHKDSSETKDSAQVVTQANPSENPSKTSPFLFAFKTDYLIPTGKQTDNDFKFSSNNAFHFQAEATYLLRSSVGVNSGINYFSSSQSFSKTTTSTDSTLTGFTFEPIYDDSMAYVYDSNQIVIDSFLVTFIVDSIETANYDIKSVNSTLSSNFTISSFSFPLLFYYNQKLGNKLSLDLMAGGIFSLQQLKFRDASNPLNSDLSLNKFGIKAILKTSLRYQFNHFGVSFNNTLMYDLKPMQYQSTKAQKIGYSLGIGLFWKI